MDKRLMGIAALALASILGGCWGEPASPPPRPQPTPRPIEPPVEWIKADPDCHGQMRRGEWLLCDNPRLRTLHRALATEWEAKRQGADRRVLRVIQRQQAALLSERSLCDDAGCVATAYRRYLSGYAPEPRPTPTWAPRPKPLPIRHKPPRRPQHGGQGGGGWEPGYGGRGASCAAEIGGSASAYLVRQCRVVNGSWARGCTADRSCDDLREMISDGCSQGEQRPGFCNRR